MSLDQLFLLAVASTAILVAWRLLRVHGPTGHVERRGALLFVLAFLFLPPITLIALIQPASASDRLHGIASAALYTTLLVVLAILMGAIALVVRLVARGRARRLLLLALVGREGDPDDVPVDPRVTVALAESMSFVDSVNAAFPRGSDFPAQIDRVGFRDAWDALDAATTALERRIADDNEVGLGVASKVRATAIDARSRLDTLRRLAVDDGQAWGSV